MVTHNAELAKKYATRIVRMKDGIIESDTNRFRQLVTPINKVETKKEDKLEIIDEKHNDKHEKQKSSMRFKTALGLSIRNLLTKKGRTIITSIAGSFGIIGVALVLALSNGFEGYVHRIESQTASTMPLNIPSYAVYYEQNPNYTEPERYPDTNEIYPIVSKNGKAQYRYNNFSHKYLNYLDKLRDQDKILNDYIINYDDGYSLNLMTDFVDGSVGVVKNDTTVGISGLIKQYTGLPMTLFHILYGKEEYIRETYDLIDGSYPENYDECVVVVDQYNRLPKNVLKKLGFFDESATEADMKNHPISFDDLYNKKFKVFSNGDFYTENKGMDVVDNYENSKHISTFHRSNLDNLYKENDKGITLKITGVLRPSKYSTFTLMGNGLCYTTSLQDKMVELNNKAKITNVVKDNYSFNKKDEKGNTLDLIDFTK